MAIAVESSETATVSASDTVTCTKPTGTVEGDVLVYSHITNDSGTHTPPSGFTEIDETAQAELVHSIGYKVAGASEPASYDFLSSVSGEGFAGVLRLSGVDTTAVVDANGNRTRGNSAKVTVPSITTTINNAFMLGFGAGQDGSRTITIQPDGTIEYEQATGATVDDCWGLCFYWVAGAAGPTVEDDWSFSANDSSVGHAIAITPVPPTFNPAAPHLMRLMRE